MVTGGEIVAISLNLPTGCHYLTRHPMIPDQLSRILSLGWHVLPVSRRDKRCMFRGALDAATDDPAVVSDWINQWPDCNWRVHMGKSNLLALDIDRASDLHDADGFRTMFHLVERYGSLPDGPRIKTGGSGGCVAFFRCDIPSDDLRGSGALGPGIDIMRGRVCPTIPPSVHQVSGGLYRWYRGHAPWQIETPAMPSWLVQRLKKPPPPPFNPGTITDDTAGRILDQCCQNVVNAPSGASNRTLNQQAFRAGRFVGSGKLHYQSAHDALYHAAMARRIPSHEARGVIKAGLQSGMRKI